MTNVIWESLQKKRRISRRYWLASLLVLAALALSTGALVWAGRNLPPPKFKLTTHGLLVPVSYPLWRQASDWLAQRKYIMLTFDDGPYGHGVDEKILAILAEHYAHAVFFYVCAHLRNATRDLPKRILAAGNMLGNHTYNHRHLPKLGSRALQHQIAGCSSKLASITGVRPALFRPPWGQLSPAAVKIIHAAGMQFVLWDANSGDTWLKSPTKMIHMSLYEASLGGHILLMHSKPSTAKMLGTLLTKLQARGFRFVLPAIGSNQSHAQ